MTAQNLVVRFPAPFPATVAGTGGIAVTKADGVWLVQPDFAALAAILPAALADPSAKQVWIYDPAADTYNVLTLAGLSEALHKATSTTSLAIGAGTKIFAVQSGKDFAVGSFVLATSDANPANYLLGQVTAYAGTSLTLSVAANGAGGTGTHADWTLRASSPAGSQGPAGAGYAASSATSLAIGSGSKSFTTQAGLAYSAGARARAASAANGANYMEGLVTSYSGTTLVINVTKTGGAGTFADWNINLAGEPGANGAGSGDMLAANNLSDVASAGTAFANIKQAATTSVTGVVELATDAEAQTRSSSNVVLAPSNLASAIPAQGVVPSVRATLTSGTAVTTADVAGATSIYLTNCEGGVFPLHDGTRWILYTLAAELQLALDSNSGHTNYHQSGRNFFLFLHDDAGTLRFGTGPAWSSDTSVGTGAGSAEITFVDGIPVNAVTMTLRYGSLSGNTVSVPANRALCVGFFRATADGQATDSMLKRLLFNFFKQTQRAGLVQEAAASWTYSTLTFQQANNSTANQVEGLFWDSTFVDAAAFNVVQNSTSTPRTIGAGIGIDSSTVSSGRSEFFQCVNAQIGTVGCSYKGYPGRGYHQFRWLERGNGTDTQTWYGNNAGASVHRSGLQTEWYA